MTSNNNYKRIGDTTTGQLLRGVYRVALTTGVLALLWLGITMIFSLGSSP